MRRLIILAVLVLAVAGVAFFLRPTGGPDGTPSPTIPPVPAATTVTADARAVPVRFVEIPAPAGAGIVADVLVETGDTVTAQQPLIRFDTRLAETEAAAAQAALGGAQAALAQAELAIRQADANVNAAQAGLEEAEAALTVADANRDGLPGAASSAQERAADAEVARASAGVRAARAQLSGARQARGMAAQAAEVTKSEVTRAEIAVDAARIALDDLSVEAPFAGVVASVDARAGEGVAGGTPIIRIADVTGWRFETSDLDESSVARITDGATATVTLDALPTTPIPARVVLIATFGEATAGDVVYRVVLEPTGEVPAGVRWNMSAGVSIDLAS